MGVVLAFAVGYVVGVRGGKRGFDEVVDAITTIRESDEVAAMIHAARDHAAYLLREVSELAGNPDLSRQDVLDRLRTVARNLDPRSSES
jgi:hypothetical protein